MQRKQKHFAKCVYAHCHWSSIDIFPLVFRITIELPCQPASKRARKRQRKGVERFKLANSGSCICSLLGTTAIPRGIPLHKQNPPLIHKIFTSFLLNHSIWETVQSNIVGHSLSQRSANSPRGCQLCRIRALGLWLREACENHAESQQEIWDYSGDAMYAAMEQGDVLRGNRGMLTSGPGKQGREQGESRGRIKILI